MLEPRFLLEPVRDIIAHCREAATVPIVVGSAGFSIFPHAVLRYLKGDLGMCGEGEGAFVALLTALEQGDDLSGIDGICYPDGRVVRKFVGQTGLADLPFPDPSLWSVPAGAGEDIWIPFQTRRGCPDILKNLNKKFTVEQVRAAAALFKKYGIRRNGFLLLGGPGETRETVLESLAFADSLDLDLLKLTMGIRIYPETPLAQIALDEGQIAVGDDLLIPRFYLARGLEDWLEPTLHAWMAQRSYCTT